MQEHRVASLPGRHARLSSMSVVAKLSLVIGGATLVVLGAFGVIVGNSTTATLREDAVRDLKSKVDIVVNMMERSDENMRAQADETAKVFAARFAEPFSLVSDRRVPVVNVDTPALYSGRTLLNGNLGVVDDFSRDTGAIATIFARQGDDFVRVATSLRKQDGSRAMGTFLGKAHPAYEAAMHGGRFVGHAQLFGKPYMSVYSPVRDGKGEAIAILYIGTDLTGEIQAIKTSIREIRIGDTGYFFALSTLKGPDYGQMAVHPTLEGKPQDLATQPVLREMLEKRNGILEHPTDLDGVARDKLSVYREAKGWDWIVAAGAYADEAFKVSEQVRNNLLIATMVVTAILIIAIFFISRRLFLRPVNLAAEAVRAIAAGDLSRQIEARSGDEMGQLLLAMKQMQEVLLRVLENIKEVVSAAARGDFSRRVDEAGMRGFQLEIARDVNTLVATSEEGLGDVSRVLSALAQGDLTQSMDKEYQGLFGKLKEDANKTAAQLGEIVVRIKDSADTINVASKEIASGNADLSQRTEEQASSLEETASSMEELTSTVKQNAENARQANHLAIGASEIATRGGKVVGEVVSTMQGISESSRKIADIIGVIDGIAFQTNILALNAAVEAARAGEQGRGFAVVATEVRNLAQRSAAAAKEIKTLIGDSVGKVEAGSRQVGEAGKTMDEILVSVKRVTDIMAEITAASAEQSSGIEQVSMAVAQMDEVTQQNAALVEQAAAAAESLRDEAAKLVQSTLTFKLEDQGEYLERVRSAVADLMRQFPSGIESDPRSATLRNGAKLPGLRSGGRAISGDETVVDGLLERLGVVATIFACEGGEFVRVSTSIRGDNGDRVLGTRLDRSHPAFVCLIDKNPYEGSMVLFGQAYMTRYVPIIDPRGSVIGAFFVGAEMSAAGHARARQTDSAQNRAGGPARLRSRPKNIVRLDASAKTASKHRARAGSSGAAAVLADDQWQEF